MECPVCYREWDSEKVIPRNLPCGHSYCEEDLSKLFCLQERGPQGKITCPTCCVEHSFTSKNEIFTLIKNWAVLAYAETFAKQKQELAALQSNPVAQEETKRVHETKAIKKPSLPEDATSPNDRSNIGSDVGLKDCSLLVNKNGANREGNSESDLKNDTVDEFLEEEPPTLAHN